MTVKLVVGDKTFNLGNEDSLTSYTSGAYKCTDTEYESTGSSNPDAWLEAVDGITSITLTVMDNWA